MRPNLATLALTLVGGCIFGDNPDFVDAASSTSTGSETTQSVATTLESSTSVGTSDMPPTDTTADAGTNSTTSGDETTGDPACAGVDLQADPDNCGGCGLRCYEGPCEAGACEIYLVAEGQDRPFGIAVDDSHVYWSNEATAQLMRAPKAGGPPEELAVPDDNITYIPRYVDLTPDFVLASIPNPGSSQTNKGIPLVTVPKQGGSPAGLGYPVSDGVHGIHAVGPFIYLAHGTTGTVERAYLSGEHTEVLASEVAGVQDVRLVGEDLFFCGNSGVGVLPATGGTATYLASAEVPQGRSLTSDGTLLYVTTASGMVSIDPTTEAVTEYANAQIGTMGIVVDGSHVYWVASGNGGNSGVLYAAEKLDPSSTTARASGLPVSHLLAQDDTTLYWTNRGDRPQTGVVLRMSK